MKELIQLEKIRSIVDEMAQMDLSDVNRTMDDIARYQPFLISLSMGDRLDLKPEEWNEMVMIYILIWGYFKDNKDLRKKKLSKELFQKKQDKNIKFLQYLSKEDDTNEILKVTHLDLDNMQAKYLFSYISTQFEEKQVLQEMDPQARGICLIGVKSIIEGFEELIEES